MLNRIGYACINTSIEASTNKTCRLSNCTDTRLRELIKSNLDGLYKIFCWNKDHNIFLFRISSEIIPFASHEINKINWQQEFDEELKQIGNYIKANNMRVSMHPGQFVNINSINADTIKNSINELAWHAKFLDSLRLDNTHRLIFHTGGVYGDKKSAIKRFIKEYNNLPKNIKNRLSLENDDKSYTIADVLSISDQISIPVVFDNLHHQVKNSGNSIDTDIENILKLCFQTWSEESGIPKIHYSTQKPNARAGTHADSINLDEFLEFYLKYKNFDFDIMFETKDKEKSVLNALKKIK
jgi:UV DNA damage endonuclease